MALVDVLLCTSNRDAEGLERSLSSLQASTLEDARILVVNDSSEPLAGRIPAGPLPVEIIEMGRNSGLTLALKRAEERVQAPFLARMDCGDEMEPDRLAAQARHLERNPDCVLVGAASRLYMRRGSEFVAFGTSRDSSSIPSMAACLRRSNPFIHGSIMMRSGVLRKVGGYDSTCRVAQDFNLYLRMLREGDLHILPGTLYTHYFHAGSSTTVRKNKASILSGLRSRLRCLPVSDLLTVGFAVGVARDLLLLSLPADLLAKIRFGTLKWRLGYGGIGRH